MMSYDVKIVIIAMNGGYKIALAGNLCTLRLESVRGYPRDMIGIIGIIP